MARFRFGGGPEEWRKHLFVFTHEPGFPNGGHTSDGMYWKGKVPAVLERRNLFFRLLSKHGVGVIFHGDEHNYSRTRVDDDMVPGMTAPMWQIISGGAGAPYYAQEMDVPWSHKVARFDPRQHYVRVRVNREGTTVTVTSPRESPWTVSR